MPKSKVVWDTPIWDEVVAELGDARPYEATEISSSYVPDPEPFVDPDYFDELVYELAREVEETLEAVDGWIELAEGDMDAIWPWPPGAREWHNMTEITTQFAAVGALATED